MRGAAFLAGLLVVAIAAPAQARERPQVTTYRVVQQLRLDEGQSGTFTVACRRGDLVTDGMWQIDALDSNAQLDDEPFDLVSGVDVLEADSFSTTGYRFAVRNNAEGVAQLRLAVTCLSGRVSDATTSYALRLSAPVSTTAPVLAGTEGTQAVACPAGTVAVTPGFRVDTDPGGAARQTASFPSTPDLRGLQRRAGALTDVQLTTTARCLSLLTRPRAGDRWRLVVALRTTQATVPPAGPATFTLSCRARETAITGAFDLSGASLIGQLPAGRQRSFRAQAAPGAAGGPVQLGLLCLGDRAARPI